MYYALTGPQQCVSSIFRYTTADFVLWLCRCQHKCHTACTKVTAIGHFPGNTVAATSTALLALDRAWEDYLNKLRLDNGMLVSH